MSERKPEKTLRNLGDQAGEDEDAPFTAMSEEEIDRELRISGLSLDEGPTAARETAARAALGSQDPPEEEPPSTGRAWVTVHPPAPTRAPSRTRWAVALKVASRAAVLAALIAAALVGAAMYAALWRNQHGQVVAPGIPPAASGPQR